MGDELGNEWIYLNESKFTVTEEKRKCQKYLHSNVT